MTKDEIIDLLNRFAAAWDARNVKQVIGCFAVDGAYFASIGERPGERAVGTLAIAKLVQRMFDADKGSTSQLSDTIIATDAAAWKWRYDFPDGSHVIGCDFFKFKDGLITLKDAYRKSFK